MSQDKDGDDKTPKQALSEQDKRVEGYKEKLLRLKALREGSPSGILAGEIDISRLFR